MALFGGVKIVGAPDLENVRKLDLLPARCIMEMTEYGFAIDLDKLRGVGETLHSRMKELRAEICEYIPVDKLDEFIEKSGIDDPEDGDDEITLESWSPINVDSNKQLGELFFQVLGIGKGKRLKTTKSGDQISTGRKQLEMLKLEHPVVGLTLSYRECAKLKHTYTDGLPLQARYHPEGTCWCGLKHDHATYRVHTQLLSTRTATGRYASKNPNLQNIPARSELGRLIRSCFVASPGTELVGVDFSQIEMRMLAWLANVSRMIEIFRDGLDIHTITTMEIFRIAENQIDKLMHRAPVKNVGFGIVYRESALGLYEQLQSDTYGRQNIPVPAWLTLGWCEDLIKKWHKRYFEVKPYMDELDYRAVRYGYQWDVFGRVRRIPQVKSTHERIVAAGLREGGNMPIQSTAAGLMKLAMAKVYSIIVSTVRARGIWCRPLLTIHDEMITEVEKGFGEAFKGVVEDVFANVLTDEETGEEYCSVPVLSEGKVMECWEK